MDIVQSALLALCTIMLGLILREQVTMRKRVGIIEVEAARTRVYLALICESLGIPFTE